ncbi:MAG: hypothetical protein ACREEM_04275 [Blastocatellia bacterium]
MESRRSLGGRALEVVRVEPAIQRALALFDVFEIAVIEQVGEPDERPRLLFVSARNLPAADQPRQHALAIVPVMLCSANAQPTLNALLSAETRPERQQ